MPSTPLRHFISGVSLGLGLLSVFGVYFYVWAAPATILPGSVADPSFGPSADNVIVPSQFVGYGNSVTVKANSALQHILVWYSALGQCGNGNSTVNACIVSGALFVDGVKYVASPPTTTELAVGEGETNLASGQLTGFIELKPGAGAGQYNPAADHVIDFRQFQGGAGGAGGSYFNIVANTNKVMVLAE